MNQHSEPSNPFGHPTSTASDAVGEAQVTLRGPGELADALPFLMGFYPDDSIVIIALNGPRGRFGGRVRIGIPTDTAQWAYVSDQLAGCLVSASEERGGRPEGFLVFLCQEPGERERAREVMERLRPLAQRLRVACGGLDVPVLEALCISGGRFWSYCCPDYRCCPEEGTPLALPGTSVMAATAAFAGMRVRGSLREMEARLTALTGPRAQEQEKALDAAAATLLPRILGGRDSESVREETLGLIGRLVLRFGAEPPTGSQRARDACDDALLTPGEAAEAILGLQDRVARDRATRWADGADARSALRLWRALARRCVGGYCEHAAAPLTLTGWFAWTTDDEPEARVALSRALVVDPDSLLAQLLHQALNEGLDPALLRGCLREERMESAEGLPEDDRLEAGAGVEVEVGASAGGGASGGGGLGRCAEDRLGVGADVPVGSPGEIFDDDRAEEDEECFEERAGGHRPRERVGRAARGPEPVPGRPGGAARPGGPTAGTRPEGRPGAGSPRRRGERGGTRSPK